MRKRSSLLLGNNLFRGVIDGGSFAGIRETGGVHHRLMLLNTVGGLEDITILSRLVTLGAPGEEVTADLDVVVRELAVLVVIHTKELSLLRSAELETGDEIDDLGDGSGHDKGVGGRGDDSSDLPADDDVVAVHEAANGTSVDTVEADDGAAGEEGVEDETDHAADTVLSEDIEGIVDSDKELDCNNC